MAYCCIQSVKPNKSRGVDVATLVAYANQMGDKSLGYRWNSWSNRWTG